MSNILNTFPLCKHVYYKYCEQKLVYRRFWSWDWRNDVVCSAFVLQATNPGSISNTTYRSSTAGSNS